MWSEGLTNPEPLNYTHENNSVSFHMLSKHCQQKSSRTLFEVKLNKDNNVAGVSDPLKKWLWQCEIPQTRHCEDESLRKARDEICIPERACCSNLCIVKAKDEWVRFTSPFVCSFFFHPQMALPASSFRLALRRWIVLQFSSSFKWSGRDVGRVF